jgi:putative PIN family toxin of toxin-antitoxin system
MVMSSSRKDGLPAIVLDTNAVLDCLLFANPGSLTLMAALQHPSVDWIGTPAMRLELQNALQRASLQRYKPDCERILFQFDSLISLQQEPCGDLTLRCRDADDQVFIDLALHSCARWLITRDRDLLSLARRARGRRLAVVTVDDWTLAFA